MPKRKGPSESATKFKEGTKKRGNDGGRWVVRKTRKGAHRWVRDKQTTRKASRTKGISRAELLAMKRKYDVTTNGDKAEIANGLFRVRGRAMDAADLKKIVPLLDKTNKRNAEKLIGSSEETAIQDFMGLWKDQPAPLREMPREKVISELRGFRDAWEEVTKRHMDLDDERLHEESTDQLRSLLSFYYSVQGKNLAAVWIRKYKAR